ncbi:MAG: hypothetical protein NT162_02940 [Candidatus Woesebacteria bacterium]|nr:hypothetical protein [Candidatus Woesebacteria bacterium]
MKNTKKYILIGFAGILAVSSVLMTVVTATSGAEVSNLQKEEAQLSDKKRYLENALVKTLSMNELQGKSVELGYGKPVNLVYVAPPEAVAKLP